MPLKEEMESQGNWLFRRRSHLPLLVLPLAVWAARDSGFVRQEPSFWDLVCLGVSFAGLLVRVLVAGFVPAGTSGRNVARQEAGRLNTTGIYSTMRHPLYVGNFLMSFGAALFLRSPWFALAFTLLYGLYYERIMFAEEEFLRRKYRSRYEAWASRTPAILPSFSRYRPAALPFSPRTVLRREYPGLFGLAIAFVLLAALRRFFQAGDLRLAAGWWVLLGTAGLAYAVLRTLKRRTHHLEVPGR
jgi:protein-S-isoprenylcysteine O-methyltransferase Ste14